MVQTAAQNLRIVRGFKKRLEKIGVERVILFGSRARGTFHAGSDFDILVVSKKFAGTPWYKRPIKVYDKWRKDYPAEFLCYTPEEFERKKAHKWGIVHEAVKTGVEI